MAEHACDATDEPEAMTLVEPDVTCSRGPDATPVTLQTPSSTEADELHRSATSVAGRL